MLDVIPQKRRNAVKFVDRNFRLACLDILRDEGHFIAELDAIADSDNAQTIETRLNAMDELRLTSEMLASITTFAPDGGDDIYFIADPDWNGENEELYIAQFDDVWLLPNLQSLWVNAVVKKGALDLSLLLECKTLCTLDTDSFYLQDNGDNSDTISRLASRGVNVIVG